MKNNLIDTYKKIYDLDKINIKDINVDDGVLFILFDAKGNYYVLNEDKPIIYSSLLSNNLLYYIKDIEIKYDVKIYNYIPLCFTCNNSLIIACKIDNTNSNFIPCDEKKYNHIINLLKEKAVYYSDEFSDEIYLVEKYYKRYEFYRKYIKRFILTEKRRKKKEFLDLIKTLIGHDYKTIIDVTCGDNEDIFKVSSNAELVVGNDINLYQLNKVNKDYNNVYYTNNNLLDFPYKDNSFDVSYCKNTLHHLNGNGELKKAFDSLYSISKKIIIIEIEDPKKVGGLSKFLNKNLYTKYLKDAGKSFLSFDEFKSSIDESFSKKCNIEYSSFENVLGQYMIAVIEKR